ncbi:MAG: hypothetical protein ACT4PE_04895 [Candidatus Eiseniibacteriota bacterium]
MKIRELLSFERMAAAFGVLSVLGTAGWWMHRETRTKDDVLHQGEAQLGPLRRERGALASVLASPYPRRRLMVAYADAMRYLTDLLPALDLEARIAMPPGDGTAIAQNFITTEWPEIRAVPLTIEFSFWTYPGVIRLLQALRERYPMSLQELTLGGTQSRLVVLLYGESSAQDEAGASSAAPRRPRRR